MIKIPQTSKGTSDCLIRIFYSIDINYNEIKHIYWDFTGSFKPRRFGGN